MKHLKNLIKDLKHFKTKTMRRNRRLFRDLLMTITTIGIISSLDENGSKNHNGEKNKQSTFNNKDLEFLKDYVKRMENHPFIDSKVHLLDMLYWLIGYYENKTASTPKEYLESLINTTDVEPSKHLSEKIRLLYNWIHYKTIIGF